jgi:hypothetical protein
LLGVVDENRRKETAQGHVTRHSETSER